MIDVYRNQKALRLGPLMNVFRGEFTAVNCCRRIAKLPAIIIAHATALSRTARYGHDFSNLITTVSGGHRGT